MAVHAAAKAQLLPSDIIWAIDTSGSMIASFPAIQTALNDFSQRIVAAGIDAHIVLLAGASLCVPAPLGSGTCGDATGGLGGPGNRGGPRGPGGPAGGAPPVKAPDSKEPVFLHLDLPFGATEGMATVLDNHPHYKHMLRPNARTQLVLTEDGAPLVTAAAVSDQVEGRAGGAFTGPWAPPLRPGSYAWNGIVCTRGFGEGTCLLAFGEPTTTLELIKATGGIAADLDLAGMPGQDPFKEVLAKLAEAVIVGAKIGCDYDIPPPPSGSTFDRDKVNVVYTAAGGGETTFPRFTNLESCRDRAGWFYDDPALPKRVSLCPAACTSVQADTDAKVRVGFGCATEIGPE